tara:strand:+ start:3320 stop:3547 length:228 start_codon:yes stop_codon:yes gene_type:complete
MNDLNLKSNEIESLMILVDCHFQDEVKSYHEQLETGEDFNPENTLYYHWRVILELLVKNGLSIGLLTRWLVNEVI